jgi:hypothetical protein
MDKHTVLQTHLCFGPFPQVPVLLVCGWEPAELWLAAQCLRWVSVLVKGLHEERGSGRRALKKAVAIRQRRKGYDCA